MRAMEPLDRSGHRPTPLSWGGTLATYLLIGLALFVLWASQTPDVAMPLLAGAGIGAVGMLSLFVVGLRVRRRPICLRRLDLCLGPCT